MNSNVVVLMISVGLSASVAGAAPDAGAKARGSYNFYSHSSHNSFSSARSHVEGYQGYLHDTHGVAVPAHTPTATAVPAASVSVVRPATPAPQVVSSTPTVVDHHAEIATHGSVDTEVARDASDALGDDIERIQRHVKRMRAHAEELEDTEALSILADIEKNLGIARRGHADLHEHHAEEKIAPKTAMALAQKVNDALRAAHADHDKLMKRLHETDDSDSK
ncbi:MAG: hypothetical protein DWH79_00345 [Planctomycetota bacterium]|nr:MAG: hypothetical protein DWH79_00345 [Planctomycetota bacterium]